MVKRIYFDMDGVLADFDRGVERSPVGTPGISWHHLSHPVTDFGRWNETVTLTGE